MICTTCSNPLASDARFCPSCGAPVLYGAQPFAPPPIPVAYYAPPIRMPYSRVARNIQTLGTLWLIYAVLRAVTGIFGVLFLHGMFGDSVRDNSFNFGWSPFGHMGMGGLWPLALVSLIMSVGCVVLTGYALLTRQPWGRVLGIIFGIFALIHFPLGTALGVYTLWVLAPSISGDEYAAIAAAQHGS